MLWLAIAAAVTASSALRSEVSVDGRVITIADLVPGTQASIGEHGRQEVARLPEGAREMRISAAALTALLRRRVPGLVLADAPATGVVTIRRSNPGAPTPSQRCWTAKRDIKVGEPLLARDLEPAACDPIGAKPVVHFDRQSMRPVATSDLPAQAYIGPLVPAPAPSATAGDRLTLRSTAGPVVIERQVTAMQSARSGRRLFVRDPEGKVFSVALALAPDALR